jgi:hypothetical protein
LADAAANSRLSKTSRPIPVYTIVEGGGIRKANPFSAVLTAHGECGDDCAEGHSCPLNSTG